MIGTLYRFDFTKRRMQILEPKGTTDVELSIGLLKASEYLLASLAPTCTGTYINDCGVLNGTITNFCIKTTLV